MVILFDRYNLPDDIFEIVFPTERQRVVAKLLLKNMQENNDIIGKSEMSVFATLLHENKLVDDREEALPYRKAGEKPTISYNKRQFYDRILTPMKSMGMIDYDLYKKHYKVSDDFNRMMIKIGLLWLRRLKKRW